MFLLSLAFAAVVANAQDQIQEIQSNCRELYEFKTHQKGRVQSSITKLCPLSQKTVTQFDFYFETHTRRPSQVKVVETQVPRTVKNKEFP